MQDYHQQAAAAAAQQLAHLQCLLPSPSPVVFSTEVAAPVREPPGLAAPALDQAASQPALPSNPEAERPRTASWLEIKDILEAGRGKLLHLGFIVRQLYGRLPPEILAEVTEKTRQQIAEGAKAEKWFAVPDSPDCWTIDLREFPDWAEPCAPAEAGQKAAIPATAIPTKQASQRLGIPVSRLHALRQRYPDQLREGEHYFHDSQRWIYWTEEGMALVKQLRSAGLSQHQKEKNPANRQASATQTEAEAMIPPYQGLSTRSAVKKLLQENRGRIFSLEEIALWLYGDLEVAALKKKKDHIGKILSAGKIQGEWQRIPGKVGFYTADLKDLSESDSQLGLFPNKGVQFR